MRKHGTFIIAYMSQFLRSNLKNKKRGPSPVLLAVLLIGFLLLLSSVISLVRKQVGIRKSIQVMKLEQAALVKKQENLSETIKYLKTDDGKEQILRDKYRLVKPGEGLVVIVDPIEQEGSEEKKTKTLFGEFFDAFQRIFDR